MRTYIARLIIAGMDRETAVAVCKYYYRRGLTGELADYVRAVEEEMEDRDGDL